MQIKEQQQRDSVRMVWNAMANSKTIMAKAGVPQALHYTLLPNHQPSLLRKSPLRCPQCQSYMNPYNRIHLGNQAYTCCICKADNPLPVDYIQSKDKIPEEMTLGFSSFMTGRAEAVQSTQMGYLFVVDVAIDSKELSQVKKNLAQLIESLSEEKVVGLITYHKYVDLHDLCSQVETTIRFSAGHSFDSIEFNNILSIENNNRNDIHTKYLMKLKDCRASLKSRITALKSIKHAAYKHQREARCTGQALNVAITLATLASVPTRLVLLVGGVCTVGLGKVIDQDYKTQMRSINEGFPAQSQKALEFYSHLGEKAQQRGIAVDAFVFGVEEAGLTEMIPCLRSTGGLLVQHQQFSSNVFAQSFQKAYSSQQSANSLTLGTQVTVQIKNSPEIVVTALQDYKRETKKSNANLFRLGNISETTTVTIHFEAADNTTDAEAYYIQIKTTFKDSNDLGLRLQRVTTLRRLFVHTAVDMINGFDQEAAVLLLAKLAMQRSLEQSREIIRLWLDNALISWGIMFAYYKLGEPETFRLSDSAKFFPQYVYYLRRSPLIRRSKISLDEYTYIGQIVKNQTTRNALLAIEPALLEYSTEQTNAHPVSLDQKYMRPESILLLDSFFNLVQWRGKNVHSWLESNLHQTQEFSYLEEMIRNVTSDMECLRNSRFPVPFCYKTSPGHSKERFLKSRLGARQQLQIQNNNLSEQADVNSFTSRFIQLVVGK